MAALNWGQTLRSSAFAPKGYRPEIDGLRAVAVVSVLLFHLDFSRVSAGFIGVDVFFVISGFLITSILAQDLDVGRFSLMRFYRRRALRILPPLILMLVVVLACAPLVMLPTELRNAGQAALATLAFASNVFFWSSSDYFALEAKVNPFLHTWSLGVEEQFYLILPVLLWGLYRWFRPQRQGWALTLGLGLTVLISFVLGVWMLGNHPQASFYLLLPRFWEMGAGAMLAVLLPSQRLPRVVDKGVGPKLMMPELLVAELLGILGLLAIGVGVFALTPESSFPGVNALWPVLGAVAVIAAGGATVSGRMLSLPPMRFLGRISYSLYLWHWPMIVLWKMRMGSELSFADQIGLGLAAVVIATFSTYWVEAPLRHLPPRISDGNVLAGSVAALVAVGCLAFGLQLGPERLRSYPPEVLALDRYAGFHTDPQFLAWTRRHQCFLSADTPNGFGAFDKEVCLDHPVGKPVLLMLGDSLSAHLWHAVSDAYPEYSVVQANASGCRPFPDNLAYPACGALLRFIYEDWVPQQKPDLVVLSARWQQGQQGLLVAAVHRLQQAGVSRVVVLGPTVEYQGALATLLARDALLGDDRAAGQVDPTRWQVSADLQAALQGSGADYVDLLALLCPERHCTPWVPAADGAERVPMSFDYGHYTPEGAAYVAAALTSVLGAPVLRRDLTPDAAPEP